MERLNEALSLGLITENSYVFVSDTVNELVVGIDRVYVNDEAHFIIEI